MFARANRLTKTKDIEKVFKHGRSHYENILGIKAVSNGLNYNRFTVIVSLKVSKKAILRNRLKRQIRSLLQIEEKQLKSGYDLAVVCLPESLNQEIKQLQQTLIKCLQKLNLY